MLCTNEYIIWGLVRGDARKEHENLPGTSERDRHRARDREYERYSE